MSRHIAVCGKEGWSQSERQNCQGGYRGREGQRGSAQVGFQRQAIVPCRQLQQKAAHPIAEKERRQTAHHRQHKAFGEHLPHEPRACGADGQTQTHLPSAAHGARHLQIRHVCAANQQHQPDQRHEYFQRLRVAAANA